jgi:hypothetical protein
VIVTVMVVPQVVVMSWHVAGHVARTLPPQAQTELSGKVGALVEPVGQSPGEPQHCPKS